MIKKASGTGSTLRPLRFGPNASAPGTRNEGLGANPSNVAAEGSPVPAHPIILCRLILLQSPASETAPDLDPQKQVIVQPVRLAEHSLVSSPTDKSTGQ